MKIKKLIAMLAAFGMVFGAIAFTACGDDNNVPATSDSSANNSVETSTEDSSDSNETSSEDGNDSTSDDGVLAATDCTVTIVDQDGDGVEGVTFSVLQGEETVVSSVTTDANGVAQIGDMLAGEYTVSYTQMPSWEYDANPETAGIEINTSFSISEGSTNPTLVISNWTAGTSLSPYVCYYETDEETGETSASMHVETVKANSDNYYLVSKSGDRIICVEQADVTIIYNGVSYSAKDGAIEIQSQADVAGNLNYWAPLQIINETGADIELVMTFKDIPVEEEGDDSTSDDSTSDDSTSDDSASDDSASV